MASPAPALPENLRRTRRLALSAYFGLLLYFFANTAIVTPGFTLATPVIWLIQTLPLLIFLKGLLQNNLRTYAWMCFVVLLYFTHGVLLAFDPPRRWLGVTEVLLCVIMFVAMILYIRKYREHFKVGLFS